MDWTAQTSTTTRQSQTLEPNTLLFISFEMLMALAKNSMNNLENVKLDEMELAILSRNICHGKPSRLCWNDEEIGVSKSNKTSKHVCNNRYKHFWAHLWCFTELNCISYHIILVIPIPSICTFYGRYWIRGKSVQYSHWTINSTLARNALHIWVLGALKWLCIGKLMTPTTNEA